MGGGSSTSEVCSLCTTSVTKHKIKTVSRLVSEMFFFLPLNRQMESSLLVI